MKYIKTFEKREISDDEKKLKFSDKIKKLFFKYEDGDYILTNENDIIRILSSTITKEEMDRPRIQYIGTKFNNDKILVNKNEIIRLATPEEIDNFREKKKYDLLQSQKFSDFAAQEYIIYFYNEGLFFGQIKNKIHNNPNSNQKYEYYLTIYIMEILTDDGVCWYTEDKNWNFKIDNSFELLFKTTSLKDAKKEMERIKQIKPYSEWEEAKIAKKYNL